MPSKSSSVPPFSFKSEMGWKEECPLATSSYPMATKQRRCIKKDFHPYLASFTGSSPAPRATPKRNSACLANKIDLFSSNGEDKSNTMCCRVDAEIVSVDSSSNSSFCNYCSVEVNLSTTSENEKHNHYILPSPSLMRHPSPPKSQYKSSCGKELPIKRTKEKGMEEKEVPQTGLGTSRIGDDAPGVTSDGVSSFFSFLRAPILSLSPSNTLLEIDKEQNSHRHSQHSPVLAQDVDSDSSLYDSSLKRSLPSLCAFAFHGTPPLLSLEKEDREVNIEAPVHHTALLSSSILDEDHKGAPSTGMSTIPTDATTVVPPAIGATAQGEKIFLYLNGHPLLEESIPCLNPPLEYCDALQQKKVVTSFSERRGLKHFSGDHLLGGENGKDGGNEAFAEKQLSAFSALPLSYKSDAVSNAFPFASVEEMEMGGLLEEFAGDEEDKYYGLHDVEDSRKTRSWVQRLGMHGENRVHSPPPSRFLMSFSSTSRFSYKAQMLRQQKEGNSSVTSAVISSSSSLLTTTGGTRTRRHGSRGSNSTSAVEHHLHCRHSGVKPSLLRGSSSTNGRNIRHLPVENLSVYPGCDRSFTKPTSQNEKCVTLRKTTKRSDAPLVLTGDPFSCYHRHQSRCGTHGYLCTVPQSVSCGVNSSCSTSTLLNSPTCPSTALGGFSASLPFITDDMKSLRGENGVFPLQDGKHISHRHSPSHYSVRGHVTSCCSQCNLSLHQRKCSPSRESFTSYHSVAQRALDPYEPPLDV